MRKRKSDPTIIRAPKDGKNPYGMVRRASLEDPRLSWEARGVLAYLLVKPDDWEISVTDLYNAGPDGRDKVYRILKELEQLGYLERDQERKHGRFSKPRYLLYEEPLPEKPDTVNRLRVPGKPYAVTPESPLPEKPDTVGKKPFPEMPEAVTPENRPSEAPLPGKPDTGFQEVTNIGWLVDHSVPNDEINQPTNQNARAAACADPVEHARTVALLMDPAVGIGVARARELADCFGFEEVRRQVAAWRPQHQAGRAQAGLLIKRIEDRWGAPEISAEFKRSEIYRRHRTPEERQAEVEVAAELSALHRGYPRRPPPVAEEAEPPAGDVQRLLAGNTNIDLHDADVTLAGETVTIALPAHRVDYARHQYTRSILRTLRSAGLPYALEFVAHPTPAPVAG